MWRGKSEKKNLHEQATPNIWKNFTEKKQCDIGTSMKKHVLLWTMQRWRSVWTSWMHIGIAKCGMWVSNTSNMHSRGHVRFSKDKNDRVLPKILGQGLCVWFFGYGGVRLDVFIIKEANNWRLKGKECAFVKRRLPRKNSWWKKRLHYWGHFPISRRENGHTKCPRKNYLYLIGHTIFLQGVVVKAVSSCPHTL